MNKSLKFAPALVLGFLLAAPAAADNIGIGAQSTSTQSVEASTDDNIGIGEPAWYEVLLDWAESDDSE